ncbi:MAG: hypothetical protein KDE45_23445, partial [Caldilineaceae bacterium]|nr:hypothetical protein [Caldilineaceae bacterium]
PLLDEYLLLSALVAALAICTGALGASIENSHYFRHITFVDEEICGVPSHATHVTCRNYNLSALFTGFVTRFGSGK